MLQLLQWKPWHLCSVSPSLAGEENKSDFVLKLLSYINIFSLAICWELGVIPGRETWETTETTGISCQKLIRALYGYLEQLPLSWDSPNYPTCCWKYFKYPSFWWVSLEYSQTSSLHWRVDNKSSAWPGELLKLAACRALVCSKCCAGQE